MGEQLTADRTQSTAVPEVPAAISRTRTIDELVALVEDVGHLRNTARVLGTDLAETGRQVGRVHHRAIEAQLNAKARQTASRPAVEMLDDLASAGFAWRDIARLVGVSVPAVRKWRQGEPPTGAHLLAIARIVAFVDTLRHSCLFRDVASWMEVPLTLDVLVTAVDVAADGRYSDLIELAAEQITAEDLLDNWQPEWRDRYRSKSEVFEAADGELGIRFRDEDDA